MERADDVGDAVLEEVDLISDLLSVREDCRQIMRRDGRWFRDSGDEVFPPWYIALGRHEWYKPFAQTLSSQLGTQVYLLDFLVWIDLGDPQGSLWWFIRQAARIDVHLKGVSPADLRLATVDAGEAKPSRRTLGLPYMTSWEINQVYWRGLIDRAWWHTAGEMTVDEAFTSLGGRVPRNRIVEAPPC